jgi:hypothetical protein
MRGHQSYRFEARSHEALLRAILIYSETRQEAEWFMSRLCGRLQTAFTLVECREVTDWSPDVPHDRVAIFDLCPKCHGSGVVDVENHCSLCLGLGYARFDVI